MKSLTTDQFWQSGLYFVQTVAENGQANVIQMEPADFERSAFLDARIELQGERYTIGIDLLELLRSAPKTAKLPQNYICHLGHVGSTLISRALDHADETLTLREPDLLRWIANLRRTAGEAESLTSPQSYRAQLKLVLQLLGRPIADRPNVVIKATSRTSAVIGDSLAFQPNANILALYTGLEPFCANVLRKDAAWRDSRRNAPDRLKRLHSLVGTRRWRLYEMSPGELAGVNWLAEMATLDRLEKAAGERFAWLHFDTFLSDPDAHMAQIAGHFGIEWDARCTARLHDSGTLSKHSKAPGRDYSSAQRTADLAKASQDNRDEIARCLAWVNAALTDHPDLLPDRRGL